MPRSLCRNAGRLLNCAAFRSSNLGNVSNDPPTAMSASTQKTARWFASSYGDLRPSGSSHASSACFSSQCKGSKVLQSPVWQTQTRLIGYLMRFTTGIRCELAIGDGRRMSRRNHRMSDISHQKLTHASQQNDVLEFLVLHSSNASAPRISPGGISSPSALAVLRVTTISSLVGCSAGGSP